MTKTVAAIGLPHVSGDLKFSLVLIDITSYTGSGEPVSAADVGFGKIETLFPVSYEKGLTFSWDGAKIHSWGSAALGTESVATTDCGVILCLVFGY